MGATEQRLLGYLLNSLWQAPLLLLAAWTSARLARRLGAQAEHRVWVLALLVSVALPACSLRALEALTHRWAFATVSLAGQPRVETILGGTAASTGLHVSAAAGGLMLAVYGAVLLYFVMRLLWAVKRGATLTRGMKPVSIDPATGASWQRLSTWFDVSNVVLASSEAIQGPVTVGVLRRVLVVPVGFLEAAAPADRDAALAHEFAHIRRRDYAKNLAFAILSLPVAFHPVTWLLKRRVAETRELVCDALAAEAIGTPREYARSLLRLATLITAERPAANLHAIGIFDANILERRLMTLTTKHLQGNRSARLATGALCAMLGVLTCGSAMALRLEVKDGKRSVDQRAQERDFVRPNLIYQKEPEYTAQARADKISGDVIVALTVGEDGVPVGVHVVKSLRADLDRNAVEAVESYRFSPAMNGRAPVAVDMTISVNFQIF